MTIKPLQQPMKILWVRNSILKKLTLIDDNDAMADLHGAYSRSL